MNKPSWTHVRPSQTPQPCSQSALACPQGLGPCRAGTWRDRRPIHPGHKSSPLDPRPAGEQQAGLSLPQWPSFSFQGRLTCVASQVGHQVRERGPGCVGVTPEG